MSVNIFVEKPVKRPKQLGQNKIMNTRKIKRQLRIRKKMHGTAEKPRLSVYRSNKAVAAQLIDDVKRQTILGLNQPKDIKGNKTAKAKALGLALAKEAIEKKIKQVVFDKGSYRYHGRVKAIAEGAREGGLQF
ncbi:MAG TPA: 50S ribosomal protein L18 [Patescibacteria group bacterium]|nr:50S ribosomal protein L18 [Patescibacteria group bacterium]